MDNKTWTVETVRAFCLKHYDQGGDGIYECYDDNQVQELLDFCEESGTPVEEYLLRDFSIYKSVIEDCGGY